MSLAPAAMSGCTRFKSLNELRKAARIECRNSNGDDDVYPTVLTDCCEDPAWLFERLTPAQKACIMPLIEKVVEGMAHVLRRFLPDKEHDKYRLIMHMVDPLLRLCSNNGNDDITVVVNRPCAAAVGSPAKVASSVIPGAAPRPPGTAQQAGSGVQGGQVGQQQTQKATLKAPKPPMPATVSAANSISIKTSVEHDLKAAGSQGPIEFIFAKGSLMSNSNREIMLVIELVRDFWPSTSFQESVAHIAHQLIGAALHNEEMAPSPDGKYRPMHGMLTDGVQWVGFRFTLTEIPKPLNKLKAAGLLEYSSVHTLLHKTATHGIQVTGDLVLIINQLAHVLCPDLDNINIRERLDNYESELQQRKSKLLEGHGLLDEDTEPPCKRMKTSSAEPTLAQQPDAARAHLAHLMVAGPDKQQHAFEALAADVQALLSASLHVSSKAVDDACQGIVDSLSSLKSAVTRGGCVAIETQEFLMQFRKLSDSLQATGTH